MTARSGMTDIILALRGMADAGTVDFTVAGLAYWTDDQLQNILDARRTDLRFVEIEPMQDYSSGLFTTTEYRIPYRYIESGTVLSVLDVSGNVQGTATYTFDPARSVIVFNADTASAPRFITGRTYNVELAASDVWTRKAAHYATAYDISTDNQSLKRSQLVTQCQQMALYYASAGGPSSVSMERSDC